MNTILNSEQINPILSRELHSNATGDDTLGTLQAQVQSDTAALQTAQSALSALQTDPNMTALFATWNEVSSRFGSQKYCVTGANGNFVPSNSTQGTKNCHGDGYHPWIDGGGNAWADASSDLNYTINQKKVLDWQDKIKSAQAIVTTAQATLKTDTDALNAFLNTPAGQNIVNQQAAVQEQTQQTQQALIAQQTQAQATASSHTTLLIVGGLGVTALVVILLLRHHASK